MHDEDFCLSDINEINKGIINYFHPLAVVLPSDDGDIFGNIKLKKSDTRYIESIYWE